MWRDVDRATSMIRPGGHDWILESVTRLWCVDNLPMVRAMFIGPRWKSQFGVEKQLLEHVRPPWFGKCKLSRRFVHVFSLEDEVRERVVWQGEELRPGVFAMWGE
jgi:hypothetical protein